MSTTRKSEAARANGAKSRGPKTIAGLAKASRNSLSHGFTCRSTLILQHENPVEFEILLAEYNETYKPETHAELDLVQQMAAARWRIRRLWTIETGLLDAEIVRRKPRMNRRFAKLDPAAELALAFRYLADKSRSLALLSRYESRLNRTHERAHETLRQLQLVRRTEKMRNEPTAVHKFNDFNSLSETRPAPNTSRVPFIPLAPTRSNGSAIPDLDRPPFRDHRDA